MGSIINSITGGFSNTDQYQAQNPDIQKQNFADAIQQSQQGFNNTQGNQQQLAQMLLSQSQGQGPNPAQLMLNQARDQNNAQAAGLMASQRGLNPALAARMAAQTQANNNQQAAGQGALMGAQQQLAAQGQLGGIYNQMGEQQLQNQNILQTANSAQNNAITQGSLGVQDINSKGALQNGQNQYKSNMGLINGVGQMFGMGGGGFGGGGMGSPGPATAMAGPDGASSAMALASQGGQIPGKANVPGDSYSNDTVPTMLSPGEIVIPRSKANDAGKAKQFIDAILAEKKQGQAKKAQPKSYADVLAAHRELKQRVTQLEAKVRE